MLLKYYVEVVKSTPKYAAHSLKMPPKDVLPSHLRVECSEQPLDFCFHPTKPYVLAVALVDGTVEVHDVSELISTNGDVETTSADDDDEIDTLVSSTVVFQQEQNDDDEGDDGESSASPELKATTSLSCRCIQYNNTGSNIYVGGNNGTIICLNGDVVNTFRSTSSSNTDELIDTDAIRWSIPNAGHCTAVETNQTTADDNTANIETMEVTKKQPKYSPINTVYQIPTTTSNATTNETTTDTSKATTTSNDLFVTGDESGCVRVWDAVSLLQQQKTGSKANCDHKIHNNKEATKRKRKNNPDDTTKEKSTAWPTCCIGSWKRHEDYISGICSSSSGSPQGKNIRLHDTLYASSADGCMSVYKWQNASVPNTKSCVHLSDVQEDELLDVAVMKGNRKIIVSTALGVVGIFSSGNKKNSSYGNDFSDKYPVLQKVQQNTSNGMSSIDSMYKMSENKVLLGCSDGYIRLVTIHPNKIVGIINNEKQYDDTNYPIEKVSCNMNATYIGSLSHDVYIQLYTTAYSFQDTSTNTIAKANDGADDVSDSSNSSSKETTKEMKKVTATGNNSDNEWDDMDEKDSDDSDDDSESDDSQDATTKRIKTTSELFFDGL